MLSILYSIKSIFELILLIILLNFRIRKLTRYPEDIFFFNKTFIECHRGINKGISQNTLQAFSKAIDYNFQSIEADVWLTKDNVAVLHHGFGENGELEGYYNSPGNVTKLTYEELSSFRTIKYGLKMPKLIDLFKLAKNKIFMNLELKDPRVDLVFPHIMKLIEEYNYFNQITISSFNHDYYKKIQEYNKNNNRNIIFGFIYKKYEQLNFDYNKPGNSLNIYWADATKTVCDRAHSNNMAVLAWFDMVDTETTEIYKELIENGVDIICCNDPLLARKYIRYYKIKK